MITRIEAASYRSLKRVDVPLRQFQVLIGPNAGGKSTLLDVFACLTDILRDGLANALKNRSADWSDLVHGRSGPVFEFALEFEPDAGRPRDGSRQERILRYEVQIGMAGEDPSVGIRWERIQSAYKGATGKSAGMVEVGPAPPRPVLPRTIPGAVSASRTGAMVAQAPREPWGTLRAGSLGVAEGPPAFQTFNSQRSLFEWMIADQFPIAAQFAQLVAAKTTRVQLDPAALRNPSPSGLGIALQPDGKNLPQVVRRLRERDTRAYDDWFRNVRLALPDLKSLEVVEDPSDHRSHLRLEYEGGLKLPQWVVSDGTLRLLALTMFTFQPESPSLLLVEEPENGLHPKHVELVLQALRAKPSCQVLVTTHSTVALACVDRNDLLVVTRSAEQGTQIVPGEQHPALAKWTGEPDLGLLFAGGVFE